MRKDSKYTEGVTIQHGPLPEVSGNDAQDYPERQSIQISPRVSFEIKGLNYDGSRKLGSNSILTFTS